MSNRENENIDFDGLIDAAPISIQKRFEAWLTQIEATHQRGVCHQVILDHLNVNGFTLTMSNYTDMLKRARRRRDKSLVNGRQLEKPKLGPPRSVPSSFVAPGERSASPQPRVVDHDLKTLPEW